WRSGFKSGHPLAHRNAIPLRSQHDRARSMNENLAQVMVASLTDAGQLRLAAGRVLLRHQAHPRSELSSLAKCSSVADRGNDRGCDQRADARDLSEPRACRITRGDPLYFLVQINQLLFKILPLVPNQSQQVAHTRSEIFLGVLEDLGHALAQPGRALREHQAAFQQESFIDAEAIAEA